MDKISPAKKDIIAAKAINPETISVGKLGTNPVSINFIKYSLQGTTQGRYLTGGVPPVRFSM